MTLTIFSLIKNVNYAFAPAHYLLTIMLLFVHRNFKNFYCTIFIYKNITCIKLKYCDIFHIS